MKNIYFDNNATTLVAPEVLEAMLPYYTQNFGNPSSIHRMGVISERAIKESRQKIANLLHIKPHEIIFTSGGTEANNLAIKGTARALKRKGNHIISSPTEHEAVLESLKQLQQEGFEISFAKPDATGLITPQAIAALIKKETILVAVMHANNELGTINPINEIASRIKHIQPEIKIFCDGVQAFGKLPLHLKHIDLYAISGHKIHAPKGVGALVVKDTVLIQPLLSGGGQEFTKRSGTENVPGIIALATASELAYRSFVADQQHLQQLKSHLITGLNRLDHIAIHSPENALANTLNVSFLGVPSEVLIHALEKQGIYVSAGSACHGTKRNYSHVLQAIKLPIKYIQSSVRFSFSRYNTITEVDFTLHMLQKILSEIKLVLR